MLMMMMNKQMTWACSSVVTCIWAFFAHSHQACVVTTLTNRTLTITVTPYCTTCQKYHMVVRRVWWYVKPFWYNTRTWEDGQNCYISITCQHCCACWCIIKTSLTGYSFNTHPPFFGTSSADIQKLATGKLSQLPRFYLLYSARKWKFNIRDLKQHMGKHSAEH